MRDELLAYLLDDVDPEQRKRIEHHLQHDPTWQHEYQKLKACFEAHEDPPEKTTQPPRDLVDKTCKLVRDSAIRAPGDVQPASLTEARECCGDSRRWSLADMVAAGAILLAVGALLMPALVESRATTRRLQCESNLRDLGLALQNYHEVNRRGLPHIDYHENAGMFVVSLSESGVISRKELTHLLVCPSTRLAKDVFSGAIVMNIPTREKLGQMDPAALAALQKVMAGSYAYQFGFVDEDKRYRKMPFVNRRDYPMLGDKPNLKSDGWQSSNHGPCGQNIVGQDGSVTFHTRCKSKKSALGHPFLNDEGQHAAGRGSADSVLGRSEATPAGILISLQK